MDRFLRIAERGACNGKRKHQRLLRGFAFRPQLSLFLMPEPPPGDDLSKNKAASPFRWPHRRRRRLGTSCAEWFLSPEGLHCRLILKVASLRDLAVIVDHDLMQSAVLGRAYRQQ